MLLSRVYLEISEYKNAVFPRTQIRVIFSHGDSIVYTTRGLATERALAHVRPLLETF